MIRASSICVRVRSDFPKRLQSGMIRQFVDVIVETGDSNYPAVVCYLNGLETTVSVFDRIPPIETDIEQLLIP